MDVEGFNKFWSAYPKKRNKGKAEEAFKKAMKSCLGSKEEFLQSILAAVARAEKSADWQKDNGQYIPYPATWLNAKGWEDEIRDEQKQKEKFPSRGRRLPTEEEIAESLK